jgi:hypothetical protein
LFDFSTITAGDLKDMWEVLGFFIEHVRNPIDKMTDILTFH